MKLNKVDGWAESSLEDLLDYYIGGDWGKDPEFQDDNMELAYCIRGSEIRNWDEEKGKTAALRKIKKSNISKRKLELGDILVEISGGGPEQPVGRTVLIDKTALSIEPGIPKICTNFLRLIRPKKSINSKYLDLYLKLFYSSGEIVSLQNGSNNLRNLKFPEFLNISVPYPNPQLQRQIVDKIEELFSELDKSIENLKIAQQQLKVYRQAVLKWAFEGRMTNDNLKDGELPIGWSMVNIGDYVDCIVPNRDKPKSFNGNIPWLTTPDLNDELINVDYASIKYGLTHEEIAKYKAKVVPINSVIMICVGKFGVAAVLSKEAVINQQLHAFLPSQFFVPQYVAYNIKNQKSYCESKSTSTTIAYLNKQNCNSIPIPLCAIEDQRKVVQEIESRLSVCDKIEDTINASLQQAEALRQSILKRAFEGKLVKQESGTVKSVNNTIETEWPRKVLAGSIIFAFQTGGYIGRTKLQKMLYLCEQHAQQDYETDYIKEAAGPLDSKFLYAFLHEAKEKNWIEETTIGTGFKYEPGESISELTKDYPKYFRADSDKIKFVIRLLKDKDTDNCELIATIYAIWNNYLIKEDDLTLASLTKEVYEWDDSKSKFSKQHITSIWQWMKDEGLVPVGFGKLVNKL